jgi:hypothetical protein
MTVFNICNDWVYKISLPDNHEAYDNADQIPITFSKFKVSDDLPEENPKTIIIVSLLVKSALPHRKDLVVPAELVRNDNGTIIGCKSLGN